MILTLAQESLYGLSDVISDVLMKTLYGSVSSSHGILMSMTTLFYAEAERLETVNTGFSGSIFEAMSSNEPMS